MGYKIRVDHSKLDATASVIESYNQKMNEKMNNADREVLTLLNAWKGNDANAYKRKWDTVNDNDSTYVMMRKSLEEYSKHLKNASSKYKKAQIDAVNRANMLSRW